MKEQAIIIILLALCAGFESVFDITWKKELVLGIVFMLGMWQDKLAFRRDAELVQLIEKLLTDAKQDT